MMTDQVDDLLLAGSAHTRIPWDQVPTAVRGSIEVHLGSSVTNAVSQELGFSPALAARLSLAAELPVTVPAPRLRGTWEIEGWIVLLFEDIEGRSPSLPWHRDELSRVLDAMTRLAETLTPSPIEARPAWAGFGMQSHWAAIAAEPTLLERLPTLDPWVRANAARLAETEVFFDTAVVGSTLLHSDVRADNILLTDDTVVFVDWPHAAIGAPWLDLLYLLPSVAMQGGPLPETLFWQHPLAISAERDAVTTALTAFGGFIIHGATQPAPTGLPLLREFQLAQGVEAVAWLRQMIG
jgi:hypothetical protein